MGSTGHSDGASARVQLHLDDDPLVLVDAFERLRQRARAERRKVLEVAEEVLAGTSPEL